MLILFSVFPIDGWHTLVRGGSHAGKDVPYPSFMLTRSGSAILRPFWPVIVFMPSSILLNLLHDEDNKNQTWGMGWSRHWTTFYQIGSKQWELTMHFGTELVWLCYYEKRFPNCGLSHWVFCTLGLDSTWRATYDNWRIYKRLCDPLNSR